MFSPAFYFEVTRQFRQSTSKFLQILEGPFDDIFQFKERNLTKNVIPSLSKVSRYQKLSETSKEPPSRNLYQRQEVLDNFLWHPTLSITKLFASDEWAAPETFRNTTGYQKYKKGHLNHFLVLLDKESLVVPSDGLPKLSRRTKEQRLFWPVFSLF